MSGGHQLLAAAWAVAGALVVLFVCLLAIGAFTPSGAPGASIVATAVGGVWLAHAWRRLWAGGYSRRGDRERRGF